MEMQVTDIFETCPVLRAHWPARAVLLGFESIATFEMVFHQPYPSASKRMR